MIEYLTLKHVSILLWVLYAIDFKLIIIIL